MTFTLFASSHFFCVQAPRFDRQPSLLWESVKVELCIFPQPVFAHTTHTQERRWHLLLTFCSLVNDLGRHPFSFPSSSLITSIPLTCPIDHAAYSRTLSNHCQIVWLKRIDRTSSSWCELSKHRGGKGWKSIFQHLSFGVGGGLRWRAAVGTPSLKSHSVNGCRSVNKA